MDKSKNRYRNLLGIVGIIKLGVLLFILILFWGNYSHSAMYSYWSGVPLIISTMILGFIIMYLLWSFSYIYLWESKYAKIIRVFEDYIFIGFLTFLIYVYNTNDITYKYIYLLSIISSAIGVSKKHGLIISSLSSLDILMLDLIQNPRVIINSHFENDLLLSAVFIVTGLILGEYVNLERDQKLSLELELLEQLKEHDYIEDMMIRNEACYNILIKQSPDAIVIHKDSKLLYSNDSALKLLGLKTLSEIKEKSILDFELLESKNSIQAKYLNIFINKKREVSFEEKIIKINGEILNIQNTSTYCLYDKKPAILTIMRDITPIKQFEKLREDNNKQIELLNETKEYNKFITEFFTNISHELKTPLNVIFSSLQLLNFYMESNQLDTIQKKREYVTVMKQNCYRLMRLINNLLDMTKLDAGFVTLQLANEDIVSTVEDITLSIVPYAENKGVSLIFDTDIEERIIAFDSDKIERILLNLLSNSLKFTNEGGTIYVSIINKPDELLISVKDTGIGIPQEKINEIFERFMQIDKTLKRNNEGTGIGLSLVKSFVELHEGRVEVRSKLNKGSEFTVTLPAKLVKDDFSKSTEIKNNIIDRVNLELSDIYTKEK